MSHSPSLVEILLAVQSQTASSLQDQAWESLRARLTASLRAQDFRRIRSKIDESDVIQQSLIDLLRGIAHFTPVSDPQAQQWLNRIVQNNLLDAHRQFCVAKCRSVAAESSLSPILSRELVDQNAMTASRLFVRSEQDLDIASAIGKLALSDQKLLELRHKKGMTFSEIGMKLNISEQAARKRWNRVLSRLQIELKSNSKPDS